jgi:succinate dehydrogenase / fumarate reductase flavoprotein subunit
MPDPKSAKNHMTNIAGLYASGECDYQYHGANRLGANSLLSCIYGGFIGAEAMGVYMNGMKRASADVDDQIFIDAKHRWAERLDKITKMNGKVNPYKLAAELGDEMTGKCTVVRHNDQLRELAEKLKSLKEQWKDLHVLDAAPVANQPLLFVNQLWNMLELAQVIVAGALARDESRGAHYKPAFPERDDEKWQKTTIAEWTADGPKLSYEEIDQKEIKPRERKY